ncbi:linoleate 9S-lipoxygenase 6-like [Solanum verrucosum]|uniref:linoleate 9S-lipoxygenase 6-like n=1 Tax=Solanum verrucosum TaxID=315347 RepID=UPI0020D12643|nr:linoleate 9S-lipoxygenase 6-like [Solanum verrucosum]
MVHTRQRSRMIDCLNKFQGSVKAQLSESKKHAESIKGEIIIQHTHAKSGLAKPIRIQLYSLNDSSTGKGKLSQEVHLNHGKRIHNKLNGNTCIKYELTFEADRDFGFPGAFVIWNQHKDKFFLQSLSLQVEFKQMVHFECNSWIYPNHLMQKERIFFSNTCYLPSQTPNGLLQLRKQELETLRGDGTAGRIREWHRAYDYDFYNDLSDPQRGERPILGGSIHYPYPRRGKTGEPHIHSENVKGIMFKIDSCIPPDERFSPQKQSEFVKKVIQATLHFVVSQGGSVSREETNQFKSFNEIKELFSGKKSQGVEEWMIKKLEAHLPKEILKGIGQGIKDYTTKFPMPQLFAGNELAWKDDEEFGRQMLAGINATVIQCLQAFPPKSKNGIWSSIRRSHIEHNLDGLTLQEAMNQWRIFILDHHNYLMPFLGKINKNDVCAYASRTLLFLKDDATLKPLAIELSLPGLSPGTEIHRVFRPGGNGSEATLWQFAKAHVGVNDSGYHQLISHWLKTHAVVEPFIIATRRQLSVMHPIHRLLNPHFKDTMHINALARSTVLKGGGIIEKTLYSGEVSMELSSSLYKEWRFDEQSLPGDLLKRGMAFHNPDCLAGVQLLFEDYPYGTDGLEIWVATKRWVNDYCLHFYKDDNSLRSDHEIQEWWSEIKKIGHGDKCNETWWYPMTTLSDLVEALTTLIWISSGLHASVNFGQYEYVGHPLNCPIKCQNFIPMEGTKEFAEFLHDPDKFFLKMLPNRSEITLYMALLEVLSAPTSDEVYLGQQRSPNWIDDVWVKQRFEQFAEELNEVDKRIVERNADPKLKNRQGPSNIPYKLLRPAVSNVKSCQGITSIEIPNSISM